MKTTRKGFTLVELLIVIVVIGILSSMMMLSSNEAVTTARANNIAANLRNLKTAALSYYMDHMVSCDAWTNDYNINSTTNNKEFEAIMGYLSGKDKMPDAKDYSFVVKTSNNQLRWVVQYQIPDNLSGRQKVIEKLTERAKTTGLLNGDQTGPFKGQNQNGVWVSLVVR